MAVWRRRALAIFPELRRRLERRDIHIADVFTVRVLPQFRLALEVGDERRLRELLDFAEWCLSQTSWELSSAAGCSFYWHVFDRPAKITDVVKWLTPNVIHRCQSMWMRVLSADEWIAIEKLLPAASFGHLR